MSTCRRIAILPSSSPLLAINPARAVEMLLSNGRTIAGTVRVYRPAGRDRLSDYARLPEPFRYVETADGALIVNCAHIVELRETSEA